VLSTSVAGPTSRQVAAGEEYRKRAIRHFISSLVDQCCSPVEGERRPVAQTRMEVCAGAADKL
jgi:hypothetical protein